MICTQEEVDAVVARCKNAVQQYGGQSEQLANVRKYYEMLHRFPEHGALIALEAELEKMKC